MSQGFSDQARDLIDAAQEQARGLGHHAIGTAPTSARVPDDDGVLFAIFGRIRTRR